MPILDANVILRYLLNDIQDQAEEARKAIIEGAAMTTEVLAEVVYVLAGVYEADRETIASTLEGLLQEVEVEHRPALVFALRLYGKSNLDFVDCILAGYHHAEGQEIMTFDKKLKRCLASDTLG